MSDSLLFSFTKEKLIKIEPPKIQRDTYRDAKEKGLILLVSYGGSKVFYLYKKINNKVYRVKIGDFPDLSIAEAREKAAELKNSITKGNNQKTSYSNPFDKMTFKELFDKYINDYAKHNTKCWKETISEMDRRAKHLYDRKIHTIKKEDIYKIFNDTTLKVSKIRANRFLGGLSPIFNKAIEWGWEGINPAAGIKKHKEKSRDRYLKSEEIPRFFAALDEEKNELIKDFILMSLYTGARKSNVLSMDWKNTSFDDKTWYIADTKNGDPQLVPLVDEAMAILERRKAESISEWVFPSKNSKSGHLKEPKKVWRAILQRAGIKDFRLHDLRRTMGSWMARTGASQYVIGKSLNHKSPNSTAIYARLGIDPVREFMGKASGAINQVRKNDDDYKYEQKELENPLNDFVVNSNLCV